jgi:hypothetical protein
VRATPMAIVGHNMISPYFRVFRADGIVAQWTQHLE